MFLHCLSLSLLANVPYTVEGVLMVQQEAVTLNTADGRMFQLEMDGNKAKSFDNKQVKVEGLAREADELSVLKVKKIQLIDPKQGTVELLPYKNSQRPTHIVADTGDSMVMGNVRWGFTPAMKGSEIQFKWDATTIKPELVDQVYFVKKPFPPEWLAAHCFLLFTFKPGGVVNAKGVPAKGFALSIEAYQRTNQNYSLTEGLKKTFSVVWMLTTWEDYSTLACDVEKKKLFAYPVLFTQDQKVKLVKETLKFAAVNRAGEFYHTITNNCTNNLIVLFNRVMEKKVKMWWLPSMVYNLRATMPTMVPNFLIKKKILGKALPEINKTNYFADIDELQKKTVK